MDGQPQQLLTAEQAAARAFDARQTLLWKGTLRSPSPVYGWTGGRRRFCFWKLTRLFWKGTFWGPQAMFMAEQSAADISWCWKEKCLFFRKACFLSRADNIRKELVNICQYLAMYGTAYVPTYYTVLRTCQCICIYIYIHIYNIDTYIYIHPNIYAYNLQVHM